MKNVSGYDLNLRDLTYYFLANSKKTGAAVVCYRNNKEFMARFQ